MRSARRRLLIEKKKNTDKAIGIVFRVLLPILLVAGFFVFLKLDTKYWNGSDKFAVSYRLDNGDVMVSVLDPKLGELTSLEIPGDTEVEVARNYGELRIKNVWQLGVNEKIGGRLLAETVTQNFTFPNFLWSDSDAKSLEDGNLAGILNFIVFPKSTNISFGDRLSAGLFSLKVQDLGRSLIDLGKNQFLVKQKLTDGQSGYVIGGLISPRLTAYFSDNSFGDSSVTGKNLMVTIKDTTGTPGVTDTVGQIIEVMGGKVISVDKEGATDTDCLVLGSDMESAKKIANIFSCKVSFAKEDGIEIDMGHKFAERF